MRQALLIVRDVGEPGKTPSPDACVGGPVGPVSKNELAKVHSRKVLLHIFQVYRTIF